MGKLFSKLKKTNFEKNTIVIITADHGEGLGEHGEASHGYFLYNSTLHVPLIIKVPKANFITTKINQITRSIDIMPTALSLMGIAERGHSQGQDLTPLLYNKNLKPKPSYAETYFCHDAFGWKALSCLTQEKFKYINSKELYDLNKDHGEKNNLTSPDYRSIMQKMEYQLNLYKKISDTQQNITKNFDQALNQIAGYESYPKHESKTDNDKNLPNPLHFKDVIKWYVKAQSLTAHNKNSQAILLLKKILKKDPENPTIWALLGKLYAKQGKLDLALQAYSKLQQLRPHLLAPQKAKLDILIRQNKLDQAYNLASLLAKDYPDDAMVCSRLAYLQIQI